MSDALVRVLVTGSRTWPTSMLIDDVLSAYRRVMIRPDQSMLLVHGDAQGADQMADRWAASRLVEREPHPYMSEHGRAGGHIRNAYMVRLGAAVCLAFIYERSAGASGCAAAAHAAGIPTWVWRGACPRNPARRCSARCRHRWGQEVERGPEQLSVFPL